MDEMEQLRQKKDRLELEQQISRLETRAKVSRGLGRMSNLPWIIVLALAAGAGLCTFVGFAKVGGGPALLGAALYLPLVLKLFSR